LGEITRGVVEPFAERVDSPTAKSVGTERIAAILEWAFLGKYLPGFPTMGSIDFMRPDKGK
jgi:hypothetical protein